MLFLDNEYPKGSLGYFLTTGVTTLIAFVIGKNIGYRLVHALFLSPLRDIPGPFISRVTSLWIQIVSALGWMGHVAKKDYEKYGDMFVSGPNSVTISNPADIKTVLASHAFEKGEFYKALDVFGIENTVSARNPELASMRKRQFGPYFNPVYISMMEPTILRYGIRGLKAKWEKQFERSVDGRIEIDYSEDYVLATLDTISALAFGREPSGLKNNDPTLAHWIDGTIKFHGMRAMVPITNFFPFSLAIKNWETQFNCLARHCSESIAMRRELLANNGGKKPTDLLQALLDARDPESRISMDELQLQAETIVLMLAGTDTSSNTLKWTTHLLMLYPDIRMRAVEEVRSKYSPGHVITYGDVKKSLPFVEACIYEALRLCPVLGSIVPRVSPPSGITIQDHFIPAGTEINVNFAGASIHKDTWDEPLRYDPTRFLDSEEARRNFLAFSPGARICPGRHLAWAEISTILANMLKDYDWSLPDDYTHLGPNVMDESGYPKLMKSAHNVVTAPVHPQRDCRLVLSKHH